VSTSTLFNCASLSIIRRECSCTSFAKIRRSSTRKVSSGASPSPTAIAEASQSSGGEGFFGSASSSFLLEILIFEI